MITYSNISVEEAEDITEPVTLDEAKAWMEVDYADKDDLIQDLITGSREEVEDWLDYKLVESVISFHVETTCAEEAIYQFPKTRKVSWIDTATLTVNLVEDGQTDALQTSGNGYYFNGSLRPTYSGKSLISYTILPVVSTTVKQAIKMLVAYRFNNRGDQEKQLGMPEDIAVKLAKERAIWI